MKVAVITNPSRDKQFNNAKKIVKRLLAYTKEVFINVCDIPDCTYVDNTEELIKDKDIAIVLGGDGTIISMGKLCAKYGVPLLGLNLGRMGFLVELEKEELEDIDRIFTEQYKVEKRMMLYAQVERRGRVIFSGEALNDAVISKSGIMKMVHLNLNIDNCFVNEYYADGIILSTPTGSTAYSLSAGGPVVVPSIDCMVVNPVCAHTVTSRPMVISSESMVKITVDRYHFEDVILSLDGGRGFRLKDKDVINIKKSENYVKLIRFENRSFYDILRTKLSERN